MNEYCIISGLRIHFGCFVGGRNALFNTTELNTAEERLRDALGRSMAAAVALRSFDFKLIMADWLSTRFLLLPLTEMRDDSSACSSSVLCCKMAFANCHHLKLMSGVNLQTISFFWYTKRISMVLDVNMLLLPSLPLVKSLYRSFMVPLQSRSSSEVNFVALSWAWTVTYVLTSI